MYFQQNGAPPHNARIITDYLNDTFPHRWIGKNGAIRWPARSPDLTPLDLEALKQKIRVECDRINPEMLQVVATRGLFDQTCPIFFYMQNRKFFKNVSKTKDCLVYFYNVPHISEYRDFVCFWT